MRTRTLALNLEHPRVRLNRDKLQLIGRSNCAAIVLVYADDFQDKVKRLVLVNHELQESSSENSQAYAAARKDQPTSGPA
jgi:pimeloyl-ACP methyl ester carboxylesterase